MKDKHYYLSAPSTYLRETYSLLHYHLLLAIILLMALSFTAYAETNEIAEITHTSWKIAVCESGDSVDDAVFYNTNSIHIISSVADLQEPKVIDIPDNCDRIMQISIQDDLLLAVMNVKKSRNLVLTWCNYKIDEPIWNVSPSFDSSALHSSHQQLPMAIDTDGRMLCVLNRMEDKINIFYQSESAGEVNVHELSFDLDGTTYSSLEAITDIKGQVYLFETQRYSGKESPAKYFHFTKGKLKTRELWTDAPILTTIPIDKDLFYISYLNKKGEFINPRKGKLLKKGPFDPSPFRYRPLRYWSRAEDGTIWMLASGNKTKERTIPQNLWRWDGKDMKSIKDNLKLTTSMFINTHVAITSVSKNEALSIYSQFWGLNHHKDNEHSLIDWHYDKISQINARGITRGKDFLVLSSSHNHLFVKSPNPNELPKLNSGHINNIQVHLNIILDRTGVAWMIPISDQPRFQYLSMTNLIDSYTLPVSVESLISFNFDEDNRMWVFAAGDNTATWIRNKDTWLAYTNLQSAYQATMEEKGPDFALPSAKTDFNYINTPVAPGSNELWYVNHATYKLNILRDKTWWSAKYNECGSKHSFRYYPYLNNAKEGRIVQGSIIMKFTGYDLKPSLEEAGKRHTPEPTAMNALRNKYYNLIQPFSRYGVQSAHEGTNNIVWLVSQAHLFASINKQVEDYPLGNSLAKDGRCPLVSQTSDGTVILQPFANSRCNYAVYFQPDIPTISFKADISTENNILAVKISGCNINSSNLVMYVKMEEDGPWQEPAHIEFMKKGTHKVEVFCKLKSGLSYCQSQSKTVTITKTMKEIIKPLIEKLGSSDSKERAQSHELIFRYGKKIINYIEPFENHTDPEIKASIQELLEKLNELPEAAPLPAVNLRNRRVNMPLGDPFL